MQSQKNLSNMIRAKSSIFIECTISQLEGVEKSGLLRSEAVFSDIGTTTLPYVIAEDGSVSNA